MTSKPGIFVAGDMHTGQSLWSRPCAGPGLRPDVDEYLMGYSNL